MRYCDERRAYERAWAKGGDTVDLQGKKVLAIGERDGVQATAIAAVARSAGAEVVLELNQCFV
jgi:glycine reductase